MIKDISTGKKKNQKNVKNGKYFALLIALSIVYTEFVFVISTVGMNSIKDVIYFLFFGAFFGLVLLILGSLAPNPKVNKIIRCVLLFVVALPYNIEYFVFKKFQVMYDLKTVTGGGGGALDEFAGDIFRMIFSVGGIVHIILFILPFLIYVITCWKLDSGRKLNWRATIMALVLAVICYLIAGFFVLVSSNDRGTYKSEYNFQKAISTFGLSTALRLEVRNLIFPQDLGFDIDTPTDDDKDKSDKDNNDGKGDKVDPNDVSSLGELDNVGWQDDEHYQQETNYNVLEIDFEALAEKSSGKNAELDKYVASLSPSSKNRYTGIFRDKNLIFISAEAFCLEAIDPVLTPTLYRFYTKGVLFKDYTQPASAGTTGGEYSNIMGMLPSNGGKSMKDTQTHNNYMTMGSQLSRLGYWGKAYHNNSYTFYDRNKTHVNLGYSEGFMAYGNGMEQYVKKTWPESDDQMISGTLQEYIDHEPFNIYYMSVSGHGDYPKSLNAMARKHWDKVENLDASEEVKGYKASNIELDLAMENLVKALEKAGKADNTVICICPDHFPYGLDSNSPSGTFPVLEELYGKKITNDFVRDHSVWLLWSGCLEDREQIVVEEPTFSPDVLPTLLNLFGCEYDSRLLPGRDVFSDAQPLVYNLNYEWKTDLGTYIKGEFKAKEGAEIPDGYVDKIKSIVKNKISYSKGVLDQDYYRHVFGDAK